MRDNEDALLQVFWDIQTKIKAMGANVMSDCSFADFCLLVFQLTWVPELGLKKKNGMNIFF